MKRIIAALILISSFLCGISFGEGIDKIQLDMRKFDAVTLETGTFIPVVNLYEISTEICPEGYKVKFVGINDLFLDETNILPKGTEFYGYIEKINEPIIGTNASMKIKITKIIFEDGFEIPIKGYVYHANDNMFGGEMTEPAEYVKVPHYQTKFQKIAWNYRYPTLQIRPGGRLTMGKHTKIPSGEQLLIILTAPAEITHTVTD